MTEMMAEMIEMMAEMTEMTEMMEIEMMAELVEEMAELVEMVIALSERKLFVLRIDQILFLPLEKHLVGLSYQLYFVEHLH